MCALVTGVRTCALPISWLVETGNHRLLFAADSNAIDPQLYARLRPLVGRIDTLFLGMECRGAPMSWLYGCLLPFVAARGKDPDRKSVVKGKSVSVRVHLGGRGTTQQKPHQEDAHLQIRPPKKHT